MRFTITPLGAAGGVTPDEIAKRVVDYLRPPEPAPSPEPGRTPSGREASGTGPERYYADRGDSPGRWLGLGAGEAGLAGGVDPDEFARVLAGRDPHTGVRLITARGSAGRRPTLGVGTETRRGKRGEPLYDLGDAAGALDVRAGEVEAMVAAGERAAVAAFLAAVAGHESLAEGVWSGSYLVPEVARDGTRWVADHELSRCEAERSRGPDLDAVEAAGPPDDLLSLGQAATLTGLTSRYLRTLAGRYEQEREEIDAGLAAGGRPRRAYLIATKNRDGNWRVRRDELVAFLRRRRPPAVRVGFDLTLTTEKSLGVLALLGDDATREAVLGAVRAGNDLGLAFFEEHAAWGRERGERIGTRGLTVASFEHHTSRALDPFPHFHDVVANTVVDEHGVRRALDARDLYWRATEASALATAQMRYLLTEALGVRWRKAHHGGFEIDGIDDAVLHRFSRRRNDILDAVRELEEAIGRGSTMEELLSIVTDTRPGKRHEDADELRRNWWKRARKVGLTPRKLAAVVGREPPPTTRPSDERIFEGLAAPWGITADDSIFTRGDVLAALVNFSVLDEDGHERPLILPPSEFERLADDFLASHHVVELVPSDAADAPVPRQLRHRGVFTTVEMLAVQQGILDGHTEGLDAGRGVVDATSVDHVLARHPKLSDEQRALVRTFTGSGHALQCAVGRAGAGKTTAMAAAATAWQAAGYEVRGAAVKGEASRILGEAAGIESETLAWYLVQDDPETTPLRENTVLIVDEASTIPDRDLAKLRHLASLTGATLRLIGDPDQHGAVGAGGMFRVLCALGADHTPELAQSHRLRDPHDLAAAEALRTGDVEAALAHLAAAEHLHVLDTEVDLYVELLSRWWANHRAGTPHPMVDRRNRTRRHLNRLAHRLLQASGEVGRREVRASGGRAFAVGDRVVARITNRDLHPEDRPKDYVRNGATGTVVRIHKSPRKNRDRLTVDFRGLGKIEIPRAFFDEHKSRGRLDVGIDHAYALTSYAVQGATYDGSASRIDEHASRAETYVDVTRGRHANHLYLTRADDPLDGERLPRVPPPPLDDAVQRRLEESGPERTALEIDPLAPTHSDYAALDLGELHAAHVQAEARGQPTEAIRRAERVRARHLRRLAETLADQDLLDRLPPRPTTPYLLWRWRDALGAVLVYRERWNPGRSDTPWGWALGPPGREPRQVADRTVTIEKLTNLYVTALSEDLRDHGMPNPPSWAVEHLERLAAAGHTRPNPARLADLYRRVNDYRTRAGLGDDPDPEAGASVLGPHPNDPALAVIRAGLARELNLEHRPDMGQRLVMP